MIYYETLLFLFILLAVIPVIVGSIVRSKPIRYFCWLLSLPFLLMTLSTIQKHSADIKKQTSKFCGTFILDTSKSKYDNIDLGKHKNLLLKVTQDKSFFFVGDTIPFIKQYGSWKFTDNEDGGYLECFIEAKQISAFISIDNQVWTFKSDCLRNSVGTDIIYFKRKE